MSFSTEVKTQLCRARPEQECCLISEALGMLLFAHTFKSDSARFVTKNEECAHYIQGVLQDALDITLHVSESAGAIEHRKNTYIIADRKSTRLNSSHRL